MRETTSLLVVAVVALSACGGGGQPPAPPQDIGAGFSHLAQEGQPPQEGGSTQRTASAHMGAGVFESGADVEVEEGELSSVGQDVIVRAKVAELVVGTIAFLVADEGGGQQQGGQQQGGQQQQQQQSQGGGQSSGQGGTKQTAGKCLEEPGTCLLVVLDSRIDVTDLRVEPDHLVELAGTVEAFEPAAVERALDGETGDYDFSRYPGETFLLVRVIEVTPPPSSGG